MSRESTEAARATATELLRLAEGDLIEMGEGALNGALHRTAKYYGYYSGDVVPAVLKVNPHKERLTDILPVAENSRYVVTVGVENILSAACLRSVYQQGPIGQAAVREVLRLIGRNLLARACATDYTPWSCEINGVKLPALSSLGPALVRPEWRALEDLRHLELVLNEARIFDLPVFDNRLGIPLTANSEFKPDMSNRVWATDGTEAFYILKANPPLWCRNMGCQASAFNTKDNRWRCASAVIDPRYYRDGPIVNGLSHVIQVLSMHEREGGLKWDDEHDVPSLDGEWEDPGWGNRGRLHSQAEVLRDLCRTILAGALWGTGSELGGAWGFMWDAEHAATFPGKAHVPLNEVQKSRIITAIQVLATYLMAVQWNVDLQDYDGKAPTVSDWEEAKIGPSSRDLGAIIDAFAFLDNLLNNPAYATNLVIADVRRRLNDINVETWANSLGDVLKGHPYADFRIQERLSRFRYVCQRVFSDMVVRPAASAVAGMMNAPLHGVQQFAIRPFDLSSALLAAGKYKFDENDARDGAIRLALCTQAHHALMEPNLPDQYGMVRYRIFSTPNGPVFDSYLGFMADITTVAPQLALPLFRRFVDPWYRQIAPHLESRREYGSITDWDEIVEKAHSYADGRLDTVSPYPRTDATTFEAMVGRQSMTLPPWSAQWTLGVAASLVGTGLAEIAFLKRLKRGHDAQVFERYRRAQELGDHSMNLLIRTIVERTDARGQEVLRTNGEGFSHRYSVMEAFQAIPTLNAHVAWMPGHHTLAWTRALWRRGLDMRIRAAEMAAALPIAS